MYIIRDREAGNKISEHSTYREAERNLFLYEDEDRQEGIYEEDFYEIVEESVEV